MTIKRAMTPSGKRKKNMTSKITRTLYPRWEIDATGSMLAPGNRISAGKGEDYDTGTIDAISAGGKTATVRWDSHVVTDIPLADPSLRVIL